MDNVSLTNAINRLHSFTKATQEDSHLYQIVKAIIDEFGLQQNLIDRVDALIGMDTTYDEDLYRRWGALLNYPKGEDESYDDYRMRIKASISTLVGGTAKSIQYSVAMILGINNDPAEMDRRIQIVDAWMYDGDRKITIDTGYGNFFVVIDSGDTNPLKVDTINNINAITYIVKAAGTNFEVLAPVVTWQDVYNLYEDWADVAGATGQFIDHESLSQYDHEYLSQFTYAELAPNPVNLRTWERIVEGL